MWEEVIEVQLSLHDVRQVTRCLRRRAALAWQGRDAAVHEGGALPLLPLRGCIEGRPTRCWLDGLSTGGVAVLAREPMQAGEPFMLRLPREAEAGLWLRCRTLGSRRSEHEELYRIAAILESQAEIVGLRNERAAFDVRDTATAGV